MAKDLFIAHIRSFFGGNKEVCFNLAKCLSVKQIANTLSRSHKSRSIIAAMRQRASRVSSNLTKRYINHIAELCTFPIED